MTETKLEQEKAPLDKRSKTQGMGRRQADKALLFSEDRYRALFCDNPAMIVTVDNAWTILSANPTCAMQMGYTAGELEGQSVLNLFIESDREAVAVELQMCMENPNQVHHWQLRKVRKDGGLLWVKEIAQAVFDLNGALNILIVCQDVTEHKRMEDELRESEERFHHLADTAPVLVWMAGADSLATFFNKPWLEFTGRSFEQEQGNGWAEGVHPDDRQCTLDTYRTAFNARQNFKMEYRLRRADGSYRWIVDTGVPRFTPNGDFMGYICSCFDITDRKDAEEEIKRLNMSLAERCSDLETANVELEAFNHTVAHDLRQPLNSLNSYCQVLDKLCGDQLPEECKEYVRGAYNVTLRMNSLIEALLNFSRIGCINPNMEVFDISLVAHELALSMRMAEPERQVDFQLADGIMAYGDARLLRSVLANLFGNAWKYTGMREEAVIVFGVKHLDGVPTYFVRDNGTGFEMAEADKLFTAFQRLPRADKCRGYGIGLATVERIIKRHGGKVWAEGEPDKGATFYFTLGAKPR